MTNHEHARISLLAAYRCQELMPWHFFYSVASEIEFCQCLYSCLKWGLWPKKMEQKICDMWAELLRLALCHHNLLSKQQNHLHFIVCIAGVAYGYGLERLCVSGVSCSCSDPPGWRRGPDTPWLWKTWKCLGAPASEVGWSGEVATIRVFGSGRSLDYWVHALLLGQAEVKPKRTQPWSKITFRFFGLWMLLQVYMTDVTKDFLFQLLQREWTGPWWD